MKQIQRFNHVDQFNVRFIKISKFDKIAIIEFYLTFHDFSVGSDGFFTGHHSSAAVGREKYLSTLGQVLDPHFRHYFNPQKDFIPFVASALITPSQFSSRRATQLCYFCGRFFFLQEHLVFVFFLNFSKMPLHMTTHPLIAHKMTRLRDVKTNASEFRRILKEITFYLGYEATRDLTTRVEKIHTPLNVEFDGAKLQDNIAIIPILRAGLTMSDGMLELLPNAAVHHIGKTLIFHFPHVLCESSSNIFLHFIRYVSF
jgi:hypothetical protein